MNRLFRKRTPFREGDCFWILKVFVFEDTIEQQWRNWVGINFRLILRVNIVSSTVLDYLWTIRWFTKRHLLPFDHSVSTFSCRYGFYVLTIVKGHVESKGLFSVFVILIKDILTIGNLKTLTVIDGNCNKEIISVKPH